MNDEAVARQEDESQETGPDIDLVNADAWPRRNFPIEQKRAKKNIRVVVKQSVLDEIHKHGQTRTDVEICGVMVGDGYQDDQGPFVYVEHIIRGQHSESQAAQVTFTGETWNHIHNEFDREYPDKRILGWYHTHPGFGVFLSAMDLFIHENYFSGHEQLAFVYDPLSGDEGMFIWRAGEATREGFLIEEDVEPAPKSKTDRPREEFPATTAAAIMHDDEILSRMDRIEQRQQLMLVGLFVVALVAAFSPYVTGLLLSTFADSNPNSPSINQPDNEPLPPLSPYKPPLPNPEQTDDIEPTKPKDNDQPTKPPVDNNDDKTSPSVGTATEKEQPEKESQPSNVDETKDDAE